MHNLSIIGKIVDTIGTYDEDGNQITAATYKQGWHVNTTREVSEWADYLCDPQPVTPVRIYAGGVVPVCYNFTDEETFNGLNHEPNRNGLRVSPIKPSFVGNT